jgi:plasmid segregation protein ParM
MFYNTYAYGHDFGNSETCGVAWLNDTQYVLTMPSTLYIGSYDELVRKVSGSSSSNNLVNIVNQKAHTISFKENSWYVGNLAIEQAPANMDIAALTARGELSRYWSDRNLALLLATSATLIRDREYGLSVVTNLPIATHSDINVKRVKEALTGDHTFYLDGVERVAHVRVYKTIMEGAGANIAYGPGGQEKVAVIDVGGRTTDAYLVKGQVPLTEQCKSLDTGVESAADAIVSTFEREFHYPLSLSDARAMLYCYTHGKHYETVPTVVNADADLQQVESLIDGQLRDAGKLIAGFIKRLWGTSLSSETVASDVSKVWLVGGGGYYFEKDLRRLFGKRLLVPETPEYSNSIGFAKLAKHYLQREQLRSQVG